MSESVDVEDAVSPASSPGTLDVGLAVREGWGMFASHPTAFLFFGYLSNLILMAPAVAYMVHSDDAIAADVLFVMLYLAAYPTRFGMVTGGLAARRRAFTFGSFFEAYHWAFPLFVVDMITNFAVILGLCFCILPGLALWILLGYAPYALVEFTPETSIWGAVKTSWTAARRSFWRLVLFELAMAGLFVLGLLCLGVGVLVAIPVISLSRASAFAQIAGTSDRLHVPPTRCC